MKNNNNKECRGVMRKVKGIGLTAGLVFFSTTMLGSPMVYADTTDAASTTETVETTVASVEEETTETVATSDTIEATVASTASDTSETVDVATISDSAQSSEVTPVATSSLLASNVISDTSAVGETTANIEIVNEVTAPMAVGTSKVTLDGHYSGLQSGDTISYEFTNIDVSGLNGANVTLSDGTIIGTVATSVLENNHNKQTNSTNYSDSVVEALDTTYVKSQMTLTFNDTVEQYNEVDFEILYNSAIRYLWKNVDYLLPLSVKSGADELATNSTNIPAIVVQGAGTGLNDVVGTVLLNTDGTVNDSKIQYNLSNIEEDPSPVIVAGTVLKFNLEDEQIKYDVQNIEIGAEKTLTSVRSVNGTTDVNGNNVYLIDAGQLKYKVISATDNEIEVEVVSITDTNNSYNFEFPFVLNDLSSVTNNKMNVPVTVSIDGSDPSDKTARIDVIGGQLSSKALVKKGSVIENNVSTTGEKLTGTITVADNVTVGTAYDTSAQEEKLTLADGRVFKLKTKGANSVGTVVEGTTEVVNTYEEVKGSVIENNVSTTSEKLTDTITVVSNVSVGTAYDTSAQEEKLKLADGRVFKLKTKGANSVGTVVEGTTEVVNVYEEVKSSVFEDNFIEGTTTKLTDTVTVVSKASVGSAYDSSAQDEVITLADGKSYKLVSKATNSTGKVAETDTYLANYYSEIKGSVVVKYVDTAGKTIAEDVVDTEDSSTGVSYDTTDNKPTMILVKNADDTVTAYAFKEISAETSAESGKVVAGETVVTYVYEEVAIVPVKDVLNKDGESVDGGKATVGDVLKFVLDGSPISDGIQGGLWQYDLKDVLDTAKVEYINGSVKVYAGEFANITLPDGSVLKADDDISSYVTIEYVDGVLTIKPTEEFYTILKDNGVEDLVDIDAQFDVKVLADGTIENTLIQIVNGFEFKSNKTTTEAEVPVVETPEKPKADEPVIEAETPVVEETKRSEASLPNTGTEKSYGLTVMGVLALFGSLLGLRKKKETE
ncbi:TPA: MucBP domain-containing protein [Streptococcus suis]